MPIFFGPKQQKLTFDCRTSCEMPRCHHFSRAARGVWAADSSSKRNDNFGFTENALNVRCFGWGRRNFMCLGCLTSAAPRVLRHRW